MIERDEMRKGWFGRN